MVKINIEYKKDEEYPCVRDYDIKSRTFYEFINHTSERCIGYYESMDRGFIIFYKDDIYFIDDVDASDWKVVRAFPEKKVEISIKIKT